MRRVFSFDGRRRKRAIIHHCACVDRETRCDGRWNGGRYSRMSPERLVDWRRGQPGKTVPRSVGNKRTGPPRQPETNTAVGRPESGNNARLSSEQAPPVRSSLQSLSLSLRSNAGHCRDVTARRTCDVGGRGLAGELCDRRRLICSCMRACATSIGADLDSRCEASSLRVLGDA